jgi:hypothetical protein
MFFVLSKVLSVFFVPSNIMVSLGLAGIALLAIGYARAGRWPLDACNEHRAHRGSRRLADR